MGTHYERDSAGEVTDLNRWKGLGKRSPFAAASFALFLLAFAGIPLTSGFIGKFSIFSAAYESGAKGVVIAGVLSSAIAANEPKSMVTIAIPESIGVQDHCAFAKTV